jgi:hypothetical protein
MKVVLAAAALSLALSAQAASPNHYALRSAGDLAGICGTQSSDSDYATALAFCHGFLAGSYGYFTASTPAAERFICPPDPAPSRAQVGNGFVAWMKARPQFSNDGAIDALFRYAAEAFPCKR